MANVVVNEHHKIGLGKNKKTCLSVNTATVVGCFLLEMNSEAKNVLKILANGTF